MALREILARFGFQVDQKGLKKAETGIAKVVSGLGAFGVILSGTVIARGIKDFVTDIVDAGDSLGKTATQLGLTGKELQAWQTAANFAGVETSSLNQGFRVLAKNVVLAQQGSKQAADAFDILGVSIEDASGSLKPANVLAREAGVALGEMEDRTKAVGISQQIFGRAGAAMLPLFKKGAKGLDEALALLHEFGDGLSEELIPLAEETQDTFTKVGLATTSLKSKIAVALLPVINQFGLGLAKLFAWLSKSQIAIDSLKSVLVTLGLVLGKLAIAKFGAQLISLGRAALLPLAKFLLLFLVVDDLIALFSGRGSIIGTFIDKIFGKGSAKALVDGIKAIGKAVSDVVATGDLNKLDKDLENIFGPIGSDLVGDVVFTFKMIGEVLEKANADLQVQLDKELTLIGAWFSNIGSAISGAAADVFVWAKDLGKSLVDGIVQGIVDGAKAVADALVNITGGGLKTAKKSIKANSPSKLAKEQVGTPMVQGVFPIKDAMLAASRFASVAQTAIPKSVSAQSRGTGGGGSTGGVIFRSETNITVSGATDPQVQKLRQTVRSANNDNRRATLAALTQVVGT